MPYYTRDTNDVDDFDEYDPTPYSGGYDILVTYGRPIPPSDDTCYPRSSRSNDTFEYQRPEFSSIHQPSAYGEAALQTEYSSYSRPKPRPGGSAVRPKPNYVDSGSGYGRKPESDYGSGGRTEVEYGRRPESGYGERTEVEYGRRPESGYGGRTEVEYGRRSESEYGVRREVEVGHEEVSYRKPSYGHRNDDDEGSHGRKKHDDDSDDDDDDEKRKKKEKKKKHHQKHHHEDDD